MGFILHNVTTAFAQVVSFTAERIAKQERPPRSGLRRHADAIKSARTPDLVIGPEDDPDIGAFAQLTLQLEVGIVLGDNMLDDR